MTGQMDACPPVAGGASFLHDARRADPDRFFCALFVPPAARMAAMVLIAFNHECTRAVATPASWAVAGPMAGLIRLQWWRDVLESGNAQRHDTAVALLDLLGRGVVRRETLEGIITARECELDGLPDRAAWQASMLDGAGGVQVAMAQAAGFAESTLLARIRLMGGIYGVGALVRYLPAVLRAGRCPLPEDALAHVGLTRDGLRTGQATSAQIATLRDGLRQQGREWLDMVREGPRLPRAALATGLPAVLGLRDMRGRVDGDGSASPRGVGDRLAVMGALLRGWV
ncbi:MULTISPECIES: squalene/phytoene synthase family protein [Komagataeibacter]|uniref:Phytoene/squalene synthase n=2 Tax=Komagataeibacter TaxID=1434011 RepID=A0A0D6QBT2_KOMXY|nr:MULTISPECIES: squalene/phytoene synthase family protein [Komagataeibacter]MBL7234080.1 squalene/phytoene synthase family protein [Komagataeibacter oboediens]MBT0673963.1 squalene/phytoene synthase family protein [Komagataeibacter oboediens]MBT0677314.1 squalene/phytoene synthase family protein [Komagataeibacter oboediens]MBV0889239.1 squalene/phytoene synthase family protein [Komagataeibacter oboediens]MCK9819382.1 squalene/phytoene synthase family protein [Komagataeibacter oboediens]